MGMTDMARGATACCPCHQRHKRIDYAQLHRWSDTPFAERYGRLLSMMFGWPRLWLWIGLSLVVATTAGSVAFVFYSGNRDSAAALVSTFVSAATAAAGAAAWLWKRAQSAGTARLPLERAADELAEQLRQQWERGAAERGLTYPAPIPVQWRWSDLQLTGRRAEVVEGPFAPLPGMTAATVENLQSGELRDLLGVYGGIGSGRLVIVGEPGAGKSSAGIRLLRDALAHRATCSAEDRARVPVPVLVTPRGWDPSAEPFADWLVDRLARDYALLRAPEYGRDAAACLIEGDHLAVILDGLDEMPEALRSVALRALDEQTTFRLVVLARSRELVTAVSGGAHLRGAAALELLPIDPNQVAEYLASCQIDPLPAPWQHVIDRLREHPDDVVTQVLDTPLMLTLVRDTYGPGERVDELLDDSRFATREVVEDHLLDRVLPAAYTRPLGRPDPPYTTDQAQRWLAQLARRMNGEGTRDLAWWQIPRWTPAWPRAVVTVVVASLASACLIGSLAGLAAHMQLHAAQEAGRLTTVAALFGDTLGYVFIIGSGLLLRYPLGERSSQQRDQPQWSRADIHMLLLLQLGVGAGHGLEHALLIGLEPGLAAGLVASFVVGLGFVLGGGPPQQLGRLRWSRADTRTNLLTGFVVGLVSGPLVGLVVGLVSGLVSGFIVGIGYMLVILAGGRPPQQSSLSRGSRTDTLAILLSGLVIGTVSAPGYGVIYVLIVILSGRPPLRRNQLRWSRTDTPTTLLTGLTVGLAYGLVSGLVSGPVAGFRLTRGLVIGVVYGLVFGLTAGLSLGLRQPPTEATSPFDPRSLWRQERQLGLGLVSGLVFGLTGGFVDGLLFGFPVGLMYGLTEGLVFGLGSGLVSSATWAAALASAQLWRRGETPVRLLRFLDDARERQVLRTVGPAYQFRHARLQDRLCRGV